MPQQALSIGYAQVMLQNVVYAMPANQICRITCDDAAATFQTSNDIAFPAPNAAVLSGSGFDNAFAFIRLTSAGPSTINISKWVA